MTFEEEYLNKYGVDLRTHDVLPDGRVVPKQVAAPVEASAGEGALTAGAKSALFNSPEALGGVAGAGGALSAATALGLIGAPETGGLSMLLPIGVGLLGGLAGSAAAGAGKRAVLPDEYQQAQAAREAEHPVASAIGGFAPNAMLMRPSVSNFKDLARGAASLTKLNARQAGIAANVGLGAALGGGMSVGGDVARGEDVNWKRAALETALGGIFHEPTALGHQVSFRQFHQTPADNHPLTGVETASKVGVPPEEAAPAKPSLFSPELYEALETTGIPEQFGMHTDEEKVDLLGKIRKVAALGDKALAGKRAALEKRIKSLGSTLELASEPEKAGIVAQIRKAQLEASLLDAPAKLQSTLEAIRARNRGLTEEPQGNEILGEQASDTPIVNPGEVPKVVVPTPPAEPARTVDTHPIVGAQVPALYQGEGQATSDMTGSAWNALFKRAGKAYKANVEEKPVVLGDDGLEKRGAAGVRTDPVADVLVELSSKATPDTAPHEFWHVLRGDIMAHGSPAEKAAFLKAEAAFGGSEELATQATGEHFVKRAAGDDSVWKDLASSLRARFGTATKEDFARLMSGTLRHGRTSGEVLAGARPNVAPLTQDETKKGQPGTKVEMGEHQNAVMTSGRNVWENGEFRRSETRTTPRPDLLFKNPDGTPKTKSTGVMYDISKPAERRAAGEPFSYTGRKYQDIPEPGLAAAAKRSPDEYETRSPRRTYDILASQTDRLRSAGDNARKFLADKFEQFSQLHKEMFGRGQSGVRGIYDAKPADVKAVYNTLLNEERTGKLQRGSLRDDLLPLYDQMRGTYKALREEQIAAGHMLRSGKTPGIDPTGFFTMPDAAVLATLTQKNHTPVWNKLREDFIAEQTRRGMKPAAAEKAFASYVGKIADPGNVNDAFSFKAVDVPEGIKLPVSWVEPDPIKAWNKYLDRFAKARAWHDTIVKDPAAYSLLGGVDGKTPDNISGDPDVKNILQSIAGGANHAGFAGSVGRLVNALLLTGPRTRVTDLLTTPIKGLAYVRPSAIPAYVAAMRNVRAGYEHAFESGRLRRGDSTFVHDVLGAGAKASGKLDQLTEGIVKYSGAELTEKVARGLAQTIGEFVGEHQRALAKAGDKHAIEFLRKLHVTPETSPVEIGARVGELFQGSYDYTKLPHWITNSPAAPFFSMMKWNVEQWNNFRHFALEPAMKGNLTPALATVFGGVLGGLGLNEFRSWLSGRKDYHATFDEIAKAPDKSRAYQELTSKLAAAAQVTGTMGVMSEMTSQFLDVAQGKKAQGFRYPAYSVISDFVNRLAGGVKGVADGEDWQAVLGAVSKDFLKTNVQLADLATSIAARAGLDPEGAQELENRNAKRDLTEYRRLAGYPGQPLAASIPSYSNLAAREFSREQDTSRLAEEAQALTRRAIDQSKGNPEILRQRLATARPQSPTYVPSLTTNPMQFAQYLDFVGQTQGAEARQGLLAKYVREASLQQAKRSLLPRF